jgi:hypothetical protein
VLLVVVDQEVVVMEDTELVSAMLDEVEVLSESSSNMSTIAADTFEHQRGGDLKKLN